MHRTRQLIRPATIDVANLIDSIREDPVPYCASWVNESSCSINPIGGWVLVMLEAFGILLYALIDAIWGRLAVVSVDRVS